MQKLGFYHYVAIAVIVVLLLGIAGFYFFVFWKQENTSGVVLGTPGAATSSVGGKDMEPELKTPPIVTETDRQGPLPPYTGESIRELNPTSQVVASVGAAYVEKYQKNLASIAARLERDPRNYDEWLGVAYIKKLFSNYIGTRDAWEYAKVVSPDNPIAYFNLGELYGYELKDSVKAEENYKTALHLNPYNFDYYVGLSNFYEDVLRVPEKAEAILLSALDKIPHTEVYLFTEIGAFYRDQKNYVKAIEYFEKALVAAEATRDPAVKKAVETELNYIRSKQ